MKGIEERSVWQRSPFIPEILVRNRSAFDALSLAPKKPEVIMFNYYDLIDAGFPNSRMSDKIQSILATMKQSTIILNSIGQDRMIDKFNVEEYCYMAREIGAKIVLTPDDYIYSSDDNDRSFQNYSYLRALLRTKRLIQLSRGEFELIGLVLGRSDTLMHYYYSKLKNYGIKNFAFSCGDLLKAQRGTSLKAIHQFTNLCKKDNTWYVLVGLHAKRYLQMIRPICYCSGEWSMSASHFREYDSNYKARSLKHRDLKCDQCEEIPDKIAHIALHNLLADAEFSKGVAA